MVTGIVFISSAAITNTPMMRVKLGSTTVIEHPGVPAGGGMSMSRFDLSTQQGDALTFDCDAPTGGNVQVMVAVEMR